MVNAEHEDWLRDEQVRKERAKAHHAHEQKHEKKPEVAEESKRIETPPWSYDQD